MYSSSFDDDVWYFLIGTRSLNPCSSRRVYWLNEIKTHVQGKGLNENISHSLSQTYTYSYSHTYISIDLYDLTSTLAHVCYYFILRLTKKHFFSEVLQYTFIVHTFLHSEYLWWTFDDEDYGDLKEDVK